MSSESSSLDQSPAPLPEVVPAPLLDPPLAFSTVSSFSFSNFAFKLVKASINTNLAEELSFADFNLLFKDSNSIDDKISQSRSNSVICRTFSSSQLCDFTSASVQKKLCSFVKVLNSLFSFLRAFF